MAMRRLIRLFGWVNVGMAGSVKEILAMHCNGAPLPHRYEMDGLFGKSTGLRSLKTVDEQPTGCTEMLPVGCFWGQP